MFLEKHSRFFRRYELVFNPRNKGAALLDLLPSTGMPSVFNALRKRIDAEKALVVQSNSDIVELMDIKHLSNQGIIALLFHRTSPNAADPIYRKKARESVTLRPAKREANEHPAVSAHMVIKTSPETKGRYSVILEEIPGLSMGPLLEIIRDTLTDYTYDYGDGRGGKKTTYCCIKAEGVKSESIESALKKGYLDVVRLVRPAQADFSDSDGIFVPKDEVTTLKIKREVEGETLMQKLAVLSKWARENGWSDLKVDIELDDKRSKTVAIERDENAKEVLFVRSDHVSIEEPLAACSIEIVPPIVKAIVNLLSAPSK